MFHTSVLNLMNSDFRRGKEITRAVSIIHQYPVPRLSKQNIFICISSDFLFRSVFVLQYKYSFKNPCNQLGTFLFRKTNTLIIPERLFFGAQDWRLHSHFHTVRQRKTNVLQVEYVIPAHSRQEKLHQPSAGPVVAPVPRELPMAVPLGAGF